MELLTSCWEKINITDDKSLQLPKLITIIRENTCLQKNCIRSIDAVINSKTDIVPSQYIASITLKSFVEYLSGLTTVGEKPYHFSCIIYVLHILYENILNNNSTKYEDNVLLQDLVLLSKRCLDEPGLISPCPVETECESMAIYNGIKKLNIDLTFLCLQFYLDILFTVVNSSGQTCINKSESRISSLEEPTHEQKVILKTTAAKALTLACSRLGDQTWTDVDLKKVCYDVIRCIKICSKYNSYSDLLSGKDYEDNVGTLFQKGLLGNILDELVVSFHKDTWKKNIPNVHALLWCVKKVKYPYLGQHITKIVPALLLLTDDYIMEHKLLGILTLTHLIENVNPSDLRLYNHDAVIYDALSLQLFSSEHEVYEATLTCLLQLLPVLHYKSDVIHNIKYTHWDNTFEKIIQNIEMSSNLTCEVILLKFIPAFIDKMRGNTIKHLDRVIKLLSLPIQGHGVQVEKKRLYTLNIFAAAIKSCWPVIQTYQKVILKIVLRLLIDFCTSRSFNGHEMRNDKVEDEIYHVLVLMKLCCGDDVQDELTSILKINFDKQFDAVHHVVKRVIESNGHVTS